MCLPNENITQLLEFCYIYPFILIEEGTYTEHTLLVNMFKNIVKEVPSRKNELLCILPKIDPKVIYFSNTCLF